MKNINNTFLLLHIFFLTFTIAVSQVLPPERAVDWHRAGLTIDLPDYQTINILDFSGSGDGISNNDEAISSALNSISEYPTILFFPQGTYRITSPINLKSNIILKGLSSELTILQFDLGNQNNLINIDGQISNDTAIVIDGLRKGDINIFVDNASFFDEGDLIQIIVADEELITSDWALHSTGQICRIREIIGNQIILRTSLRRTYQTNNNPRIIKILPIENSGVMALKIERMDATESQTSNISLTYAANCFVKCVESSKCNFAHISIRRSTNIEIIGNYFYDAFDYGGGGKGYGVMIHSTSGECLVENNIFKHLRHSMILQSGANGNAFTYNYSIEPYWTDVSLPENSAGDMVLHGNYPYCNLFEGNIVQNIVIDASHGINGPFNTFFRNRAELYGIFMNNNPASDSQNFIANEVTNNELLKGLYFLNGENHLEYGNNIKGEIRPSKVDNLEDKSYFYTDIPDFYSLNSNWAPIGIPNEIDIFSIEAKERYEEQKYTICSSGMKTNVNHEVKTNSSVKIFPNPTSDFIRIISANEISKIQVFSICGIMLKSFSNTDIFDINYLNSGVYLLKIYFSNNDIIIKKIIKI